MPVWMPALFENLSTAMMVGILVVVAVSQFHRVAGAILSVLFWGTVAVVGSSGYDQGHQIGLPGLPFSRPIFFAVCLGFAMLHAFAALSAVRARQREAERRRLLSEESDV